ncbi:hypothetical protein NC651_016226 [Populus alba x Populus x berolinensis]|nr:hypothetical protein NC651_016226 [Populus alba x Populus x berolinensis]
MEMGLCGLLVICGSDGLEDERVGFIGFGAGLWEKGHETRIREGVGGLGLVRGRGRHGGYWESMVLRGSSR